MKSQFLETRSLHPEIPIFSTVIEHIRKVHCAERDDQIRAQDQLIQQQSNKIEHSKSVHGSGGGVNANGRKHHPLSNKSKRPFVCPTCSKGFAQKIHLETHLKNVHLKDKPYKCSFCEYSCANKGTKCLPMIFFFFALLLRTATNCDYT